MHPSFIPPRQVMIGDAASFVGTTPRAIRHYEDIGLLLEPERGSDGRRRYGYEDMIRLLWIRKMTDVGIALDEIRGAFAGAARVDGDSHQDIAIVLERLEGDLVTRQAELERRRSAVQRMRSRGSRMGLLDNFVAGRLEGLPEGSLSQADLDTLLVTERILGPLGAAVQAGRFIALSSHPGLREESDRVDAAEEALDDTVAVDDPRVARVAADRNALEKALQAAIEHSGQQEEDEALFDSWDALREGSADRTEGEGGPVQGRQPMKVAEVIAKMPYNFSPARLRCIELAEELAADKSGDS